MLLPLKLTSTFECFEIKKEFHLVALIVVNINLIYFLFQVSNVYKIELVDSLLRISKLLMV
jgi:hypothetical protein